jgi:hypothetical protein
VQSLGVRQAAKDVHARGPGERLRRHERGAKPAGKGTRTCEGQRAAASSEVARMQVRVADRHRLDTWVSAGSSTGGRAV